MKILKLNLIFSLLIILSLSSFTITKEAKKSVKGKIINSTSEDDVYWFTVGIKIDERTNQYKIMGAASKLSKGLEAEFEKEVWYGISRRQIVVGPFPLLAEATNARMLYKKDEEKINNIPSEDNPTEVYWFFVTFKQLDRLGSYVFERMPAAVASGSTTDFVDALYEGITFNTLAIGPFWEQTVAENSKALYRENE